MTGLTSFDQVRNAAPRGRRIAVAGADDPAVLDAVALAVQEGIVAGGALCISRLSRAEAAAAMARAGLDPQAFQVTPSENDAEACRTAVAAVQSGEAGILMKGFVHTADFMRAVLDREAGLTTGEVLCQTGVYHIPRMNRLILMADVGIVISPNLQQLAGIAAGAVRVATALGIAVPKVAMLSAVETVNPAIPGNANAALIVQMAARGQIHGAKHSVFDGPLGLDNAISPGAAAHKGIVSEVAGRADILIAPDLNAGNMMAKSVVYLAHAGAAGVVTGASCPVVLTSRSDSPETKLNSIAVAAILGEAQLE